MPSCGASAAGARPWSRLAKRPRQNPCRRIGRLWNPATSGCLPPRRRMARDSPFHVPWLLHHLGGWVHRCRRFFVMLGRLESHTLAHELSATPVTAPLYVCGLARSGSTLLHETLAGVAGVATHRV